MQDYEKLGVFYLGKEYDPGARRPADHLLLYDSRDLLTHAVCVGMTGSGKTGLCIGLIEEAAIDGIPAIVIDPKGDLSNLLLTFPELRPEDLRPFINEDEAAAKGISADQFAAGQAELWRKGLAEWGQSPERIARLKRSAEFALYTPASRAGTPVSILGSFAAPPAAVVNDREAMRERVSTAASSLLSLAGIDADPMQSREHILLSTILDQAWRAGKNLSLADIVEQIQQPPVSRIGVLDLDSFYPAKDRFQLTMALNNLLAAPGFEAWLEGAPLDPGRLLRAEDGRPRVAIFSIAHLSDAERMFFVSLLLSQIIAWMRAQSGTTSLRALLYMDEIFGYFPPVANPPSKQPLLTLLKQARAFGLGVVLATQNPVDLDYKGLANAGTWFIGRLQTERDKARLLDGLESAAGNVDRAAIERILSGLGSRIFLLHNVHEGAPAVFQTRWTLSYLRGPLTREQLAAVAGPRPAVEAPAPATAVRRAPAEIGAASPSAGRPVLPPDVPQHFAPLRSPKQGGADLVYVPMLYGAAGVRFTDTRMRIDDTREVGYLAPIGDSAVPIDWTAAEATDLSPADLEDAPAEEDARYAALPPAAAKPRSYAGWTREFAAWLYQTQRLDLLKSEATGLLSNPDESERDFRARLQQAAREERDNRAAALRAKYAPKIAALEERLRRAQQAVERQRAEETQQKTGAILSIGATLVGAFLGRKTLSATNINRASTAMRSYGRVRKEAEDVALATENVEAVERALEDLNAQFEAEVREAESAVDAASEELQSIAIAPKKTNIAVKLVSLVWVPHCPTEPRT